ncbi:MAG: flagellar biosynthesis protein FlhF [Zoogloeaceae bacterium]|jgi:flagellar biosynthesis protein FlhF|nr:flagellar biosynthesis protein FlhF [Zoogloeaceae bacterium]
MNVRKFVAANAPEALRKIKETLGPDAVILSNRSVAGGVEIMAVAHRDLSMIVPPVEERPRQQTPPPSRFAAPVSPAAFVDDSDENYHVSLSSRRATPVDDIAAAAHAMRAPLLRQAAAQSDAQIQARMRSHPTQPAARQPAPQTRATSRAAAVVNAGIPKPDSLRTTRANDALNPSVERAQATVQQDAEVIPAEVLDEIRSLRKIVEQHLAGFAWGETARTNPVKTEVLRRMLEAGFSPQFARELLNDLPAKMNVKEAMAWSQGIADMSLFTAGEDIVDQGGVYALMGPTGVGKTTTTAKLAARCVLKHGASKVALVTTDSYRIGAYEQLRIYGRILGVTVYLAKDAEELRQTLLELSNKHMVLIDTMGMSQKDKLVAELNAMLSESAVRRLLLLSSTARGDTLDDVVRAYRGSDLTGCVLTKVDEAVSLAPALDVIMRHGLKLHYVSNGQRVPEDLHLPNRTYLLHRAFKEAQEATHRYTGLEPGLMMANAGLMASGAGRG